MKTLEEIASCPKHFLDAADVSEFMGVKPQSIREQAQANPDKLGFPVVVIKNRVRIPRDAFVYFYQYGRPAMK